MARVTVDAEHYLAMAEDPGTFSAGAYGFRIGMPFLAYLLPLSPAYALAALNTVALAGVAAVLFRLVVALTSLSGATFVTLLFLASPAAVATARSPFLVDAPYYLSLIVCLALSYKHRWWSLALALGLSVLFKESVLLLVPSLILIAARSGPSRPHWRQLALLIATPTTVYVLLHWTPLFWGFVPETFAYGSGENFRVIVDYIDRWGSVPKVVASSFLHSWSALWVVFCLAILKVPEPVKLSASFVLVCMGTMLLAPDWPRMLYPAFIVVLPAVAFLPVPWQRQLVSVTLLALQTAFVGQLDPSGFKYALEVALVLGIVAAFGPELRQVLSSFRRFPSVRTLT